MEIYNMKKVDGTVAASFQMLNPTKVPKHLRQRNPTRRINDFDPNTYFTVLSHLSMKPGYILDYVYDHNSLGGHPCLYARTFDEKSLGSSDEHHLWKKRNNLLSFLVADDSLDSFFQLAVFRQLGGQFYLDWHANYNDHTILTTPAEVETLIANVNVNGFGAEFTEDQIERIRATEIQPTIELFANQANVTYCIFTKWGGLFRVQDSYSRLSPHILLSHIILSKVCYDCCVSF
jgi:hypothetical protein